MSAEVLCSGPIFDSGTLYCGHVPRHPTSPQGCVLGGGEQEEQSPTSGASLLRTSRQGSLPASGSHGVCLGRAR